MEVRLPSIVYVGLDGSLIFYNESVMQVEAV